MKIEAELIYSEEGYVKYLPDIFPKISAFTSKNELRYLGYAMRISQGKVIKHDTARLAWFFGKNCLTTLKPRLIPKLASSRVKF